MKQNKDKTSKLSKALQRSKSLQQRGLPSTRAVLNAMKEALKHPIKIPPEQIPQRRAPIQNKGTLEDIALRSIKQIKEEETLRENVIMTGERIPNKGIEGQLWDMDLRHLATMGIKKRRQAENFINHRETDSIEDIDDRDKSIKTEAKKLIEQGKTSHTVSFILYKKNIFQTTTGKQLSRKRIYNIIIS